MLKNANGMRKRGVGEWHDPQRVTMYGTQIGLVLKCAMAKTNAKCSHSCLFFLRGETTKWINLCRYLRLYLLVGANCCDCCSDSL